MGRFLTGLLALVLMGCDGTPAPERPRVAVASALGSAPTGFARAEGPRAFQFPADHGPHPEFRNEWWYLTGNLRGPAGERFGFQVTFFRIALSPETSERPSRWATDQVWMAHGALTEVHKGEHRAEERFARQALGLAGAQAEPLRVWLGDWRLESPEGTGPWVLSLHTDPFDLTLSLEPIKPIVLQGNRGLSQKSAEPGNASYYYSLPRLRTGGQIRSGAEQVKVEGWAWLDREWSTSALGPDQAGWDWFALQLADGRELMFYRLRRLDGSADPHSAGSLVEADGSYRPVGPEDIELRPLHWWSQGERRYPIDWELEIKPWDQRLQVKALVEDQLMDLSVRYWEGAVEVRDPGGPPLGSGYLELAGY